MSAESSVREAIELVAIGPRKRTWLPRTEPITHEQAKEAATRLIHSHFGLQPSARMSIPVQLSDDDVTIMDYIDQQLVKELGLT